MTLFFALLLPFALAFAVMAVLADPKGRHGE